MSTGAPTGANATAILSVWFLGGGPLFCAGVPPKKVDGLNMFHLNMDGSLPENDPGRCNFVPTTPELVEGAN